MTRSSRWLVFSFVSATLAAQAPAPAGESEPLFTAAEAHAFAFCKGLSMAWRGNDAQRAFRAQVVCPGYDMLHCRLDAEGVLQCTEAGADPARVFAGGNVLLYLVPMEAGAAARRTFCVRGDGVVAFSDNSRGFSVTGENRLSPEAALGAGSSGGLRDFPRTPAMGRDGNLWQPFEMVVQRSLRVLLQDEDGAPIPMVVVATVPEERPAFVLDAALPVGEARTLFEGDAMLSGAPARGVGFVVKIEGVTLPIEAKAIVLAGKSARVTVTKAALGQLVMNKNEWVAIATLKNISSAQAQCQASCVIDTNGNGAGEYGTFAELSGEKTVRGGTHTISPPVLSTAFGRVEQGVVVRSGYCFRIFLPGKAGVPVAELAKGGGDAASVDGVQAETLWCAYAWPSIAGETGQSVFFIDHSGDILRAPNAEGTCSGAQRSPAAGAARQAGTAGNMQDPGAGNAVGNDGQTWVVHG